MDSRLHGIPLRTTQMTPKAATLSGIRAPLTIDESDFEHSVSSKSRRNSTTSSYYSGSELESDDGYVSGGEEFETASERLFVHDPDEEIVEETHFVKEYAFSRPFVKNPDGDRVQESGNDVRYGLSRSVVKNPDGEIVQESGSNVVGSAFSRPYVRKLDRGSYEGDSSDSDYDDVKPFANDSGGENVARDGYGDSRSLLATSNERILDNEPSLVVSSETRSRLPIARISGDSDDDSGGSEVSGDDGFSGIARVQSTEVLQSISFAPKVRILDLDEEEDNESESENTVEREFVEDLVVDNGVLGSKGEEAQFGTVDAVHDVVLTDISQDECPGASKELRASSLAADEEYNSMSESEWYEDQLHLDDEIQEKYVSDDGRKHMDLINVRELTDQVEDTVFPGQISPAAPAAELECPCETVKTMIPEVAESENCHIYGAVPVDERDSEIGGTGIEDNFVVNQDFESAKLENESEQQIDPRVELPTSDAASEAESFRQSGEIKEVPSIAFPLFLEPHETPKNIEEALTPNDHLTDNGLTGVSSIGESVKLGTKLDQEINNEAEKLATEFGHLTFHTDTKSMVSEIESELASTSLCSGQNIVHSQKMDDQIFEDWDEEVDADHGISDRVQIIDSSALAALLNAARTLSDDGMVTFASVDDIESFSLGRESSAVSVNEARIPDPCASSLTTGKSEGPLSKEEKKQLEKIQHIREKYLWLLNRLGCSREDSLAANVLNQITLAETRFASQSFILDSAQKAAMEFEVHTKKDLDFSLSILVIGKTGVGKSATTNSLVGEKRMVIDAFKPASNKLKETIGTIDGIKVKFFDTPGLKTSLSDQSHNRKILLSIKKRMQKHPPDLVLYVDRLDTQTSNFDDLPLLKSVTTYLGSSTWCKCIIALTHAASLPPDGPDGCPLRYELLVANRSRALQQMIRHSAREPTMLNPVSLVENQCGEKLLLHGESWKSQLLLLCCSMKTLSELNSIIRPRNAATPSLSLFFPSMLQSNIYPQLSDDDTSKETCMQENVDKVLGSAKDVAVHVPNSTHPPSFGSDSPFRYRSVEHSPQLHTRPVLDFDGRDHDSCYDGVVIKDRMKVAGRFPAVVSVQLFKDKEEFSIQFHPSLLSQFHVGTSLKVNVQGGLRNKLNGQISVRTSSSDQLQIAVIALLPIAKAIFMKIFPRRSSDYSK